MHIQPEHYGSFLVERFTSLPVSKQLINQRELEIEASIAKALRDGNQDQLFSALTALLDNPSFDNSYELVDQVLNIAIDVASADEKQRIEKFIMQRASEIHPPREARLQAAQKRFERQFEGGEYFKKRAVELTQAGTTDDPLIGSYDQTKGPNIYVPEALAFSLYQNNGEPVYFRRETPIGSILYEVDGLNNTTYILERSENLDIDLYRETEKPKIKTKQDPQEIVDLAQSDRLQRLLSSLEKNIQGSGTETDPYRSEKLNNLPYGDILVGLVKSAQAKQPVMVQTSGVLMQIDAQYLSVRHIAGSSYTHITTGEVLGAIEKAKKIIDEFRELQKNDRLRLEEQAKPKSLRWSLEQLTRPPVSPEPQEATETVSQRLRRILKELMGRSS